MTDAGVPDLEAYTLVDAQPDTTMLTHGMELTAQWPAVRTLRAWEREHLAVGPGDRVLDVGCGLGDVATELAADVGPDGEVVAMDASTAMLDVGRARVPDARPISFITGDATALQWETDSFDACRSERMLQWLEEPAAAVAEIARVVRPGGRVCLTDTDWRTLTFDVDDTEAEQAVFDALLETRGRSGRVGGLLLNLCRDVGLVDLDITGAAHVWTRWDPDAERSLPGLFPFDVFMPQLVERGLVEEEMATRFVDSVQAAARAGRLSASLGMFAVFGRSPHEHR